MYLPILSYFFPVDTKKAVLFLHITINRTGQSKKIAKSMSQATRARANVFADSRFCRSYPGQNMTSYTGTRIVPKKIPSKKRPLETEQPLATEQKPCEDISQQRQVFSSEKEGLPYKVPPLSDHQLRSTGRAAVSPFFSSVIGQAQALDHGHVFDDGRTRRGQHIARNRRRGAAKKGRSPVFR